MNVTLGFVYKTKPVDQLIEEVKDVLEEDYVEVEQYRTAERRVWVHLDRVEAVAIDKGIGHQWICPPGHRHEISQALFKRFA